MNRFGVTNYFQIGKLLAVLCLLAGFLVSIETFREIRIPFTAIRLGGRRTEHGPLGDDGRAAQPGAASAATAGSTSPAGSPPANVIR